ncbi:MAG TPA: TMEM165/GDT1 family protein [Candidatus Binatia bacterium]|nr:TMEM165/GDT1 family protein [Candidatus Binatia bacterium]
MSTALLEPFAIAFGVVFAAEFGDKTQLMVLTLAARLRALPVLVGVAVAAAAVSGVSVALGAGLGAVIPTTLVTALAGLVFLLFAVWTARGEDDEDDEAAEATLGGGGVARSALGVAVAFFLAELGDKTMLATVALAARAEPLATWAGAALALVAVNAIAIAVGRQLGTRLPKTLVRRLAAAAFAVFGVLLLVEAARTAALV